MMKELKIGDLCKQFNVSADTLRYYEKIGLLTHVLRTDAGVRVYSKKNISQLNFIKRAQRMDFTLAVIKNLLQMREDPQHARLDVRQLTRTKLTEVEAHLDDLNTLRDELTLLVNLCTGSDDGCPIIEQIDGDLER